MKIPLFFLTCGVMMTSAVIAWGQSVPDVFNRRPGPEDTRKPDMVISRPFAEPIDSLAFDPDSKFLAVIYHDRSVRVYDARLDDQSRPIRAYQFNENRYKVMTMGFGGTNMLVLVGADRGVRVWDIGAGKMVQSVALRSGENFGDKMVTAFAPARWSLLAGAVSKNVTVWNSQTGEALTNFVTNDSGVAAMAFTPDKKSLVIGTWKGVVRVLDVAVWKVTRIIDLDSPIHSLAATTNRVLLGYGDGTVAMLKFEEQPTIPTVKKQAGAINAVAFSADGKRFASASADGMVKVWDAESMKLLWSLEGQGGAMLSVAFSPDGQEVAAGDTKGVVSCWKIQMLSR